MKIPLAKPNIKKTDIDRVVRILESGMIVQGEEVSRLENNFIIFSGSKSSAAVANGTASLHLALIALGIGPGDEVIVPAFSYIATANVVELVGAKPVFVDILPGKYTIDPAQIEKALTSKTKAIIPVHEFGLPCEMDEIMEIAENKNLFVIEDAACALGSFYKGMHVGTFGDFGSFSLHPRKAITSGEGGILISNKIEKIQKIKVLRNHGISLDGKSFEEFGFNYRLTDIQAALVNGQFERIEENLNAKKKIAEAYQNHLRASNIKLPEVSKYMLHSWQSFHILFLSTLERDRVRECLLKVGIQTNYGAQCMPFMKKFKDKYKLNSKKLFPEALKAFQNGLVLPMFEEMTKEQLDYTIHQINIIVND